MTPTHEVLSHQQWIKARKELLAKEKAFTRLREELSQERRALGWEAVEKEYLFSGPNGKETLAQLFDRRSQLIIYHFMFHADWDAGCPHCSRWADSFNGAIVHLNHRDVTMVAISHAPYPKLAAYARRMGWTFKWLSSLDSNFNFDYNVSFTREETSTGKAFYNYTEQNPDAPEREGISVFFKDSQDRVFHTYSTYARGIDMMNVDYQYLDLVPKGRDENGRGPYWVRRRDEYDR